MLESFISTQKLSVQKMLGRKFGRFMAFKADFLELLMAALQGLVREQLQLEAIQGAPAGDAVVVPLRCARAPARRPRGARRLCASVVGVAAALPPRAGRLRAGRWPVPTVQRFGSVMGLRCGSTD
jgi:hypothetical protein